MVRQCDIIGDVHGCYDELADLLGKLGHSDLLEPGLAPAPPGTPPRLVFVGDLVDRGDGIMAAVMLVYRLCRLGYALSVIGNHDDRFLRWLVGRKVEIRHGLQETIDEFLALSGDEQDVWSERLIDFFSELPWALRINRGKAIVAHAAWHAELYDASTDRLRSYTLYGPTTGNRTPEGFPERIDWAPKYHGPELVVFGHQIYDEPYVHEHAIGIDTGCVFGGALTALRYPQLELFQTQSFRPRYSKSGKRLW